jgi:hypothetical protein
MMTPLRPCNSPTLNVCELMNGRESEQTMVENGLLDL